MTMVGAVLAKLAAVAEFPVVIVCGAGVEGVLGELMGARAGCRWRW